MNVKCVYGNIASKGNSNVNLWLAPSTCGSSGARSVTANGSARILSSRHHMNLTVRICPFSSSANWTSMQLTGFCPHESDPSTGVTLCTFLGKNLNTRHTPTWFRAMAARSGFTRSVLDTGCCIPLYSHSVTYSRWPWRFLEWQG